MSLSFFSPGSNTESRVAASNIIAQDNRILEVAPCKNRRPSGLMASGRAPLLAPNPLRTGLEGFPSSGSSTQKRPLKKRGRGRIQKENPLDTGLLPIRTAVENPPPCVKLHQRLAPSPFAFVHTTVSQRGSSLRTNRKITPVPGRGWCLP